MAKEGGKEKKKDFFKGKLFGRHQVGVTVHLGRTRIYLADPIFHLGCMYTLIWELRRGVIFSPRSCG